MALYYVFPRNMGVFRVEITPKISGDLFNSLIASARELGISPGLGALIFLLILALAVMGSAFWAAAVAEDKGRDRILHFLGGLVLPYLYPALLIQRLKPRIIGMESAEAEKAERGELPESRVEGVGRTPIPAGQSAARPLDLFSDSQELNLSRFDQLNFRAAAFNEHGEARGPFYFTLDDGTEFCATRILDTLSSVLLLELSDEFGNAKKLRIPYARITSCSTAQVHAAHAAEEPDWDGGTETIAIRLPEDFMETREMPIPHDIIDTQEVDVEPRNRR